MICFLKRLFFICLLYKSSYGQTKEASLAWIKDKISQNIKRDYCDNQIHSIEVGVCSIVFKYAHKFPYKKRAVEYYLIEIPTKDLRINYQGCFVLSASDIKEYRIKSIKQPKAIGRTCYYPDSYSSISINLEGESDLFEKLNNELSKLNSFCN